MTTPECTCTAVQHLTDYGTGVEHDVDTSSCLVHRIDGDGEVVPTRQTPTNELLLFDETEALYAVLVRHRSFDGACEDHEEWDCRGEVYAEVRRIIDARNAQVEAMVLRRIAKRMFNGAGDPWQEYYNRGYAPRLEALADHLEREVKSGG